MWVNRIHYTSVTNFQQPAIGECSYRISNAVCKTNKQVLQQIKMKWQARSQNLVIKIDEIGKMLYKLVKEQSTPSRNIEDVSIWLESPSREKKIEGPPEKSGNPYKLLASYRKEIKQTTKIKSGDAAVYRLFIFQNPLDTPGVLCMALAKAPGYLQHGPGPIRRFSMHMWRNAHINNVRRAMVCDMSFSFLKFYNFIKGIVHIYIVFLKKLRPLFLYLPY